MKMIQNNTKSTTSKVYEKQLNSMSQTTKLSEKQTKSILIE